MRRGPFLLIAVLVLASCRTAPLPTSTTTTSTTVPAVVDRLVVLDAAGAVSVLAPDGSDRVVLAEGGEMIRFQPVWAPSGRVIAWGESGAGGSSLRWSGRDGSGTGGVAMSSLPFYLYWSPDSRFVAALHSGPEGEVVLEVVEVASSRVVARDSGVPYYFSWSPDSTGLAAHIGADRLALVAAVGAGGELGETQPGYLAPHWTGQGIIHLGPGGLELLHPDGGSRRLTEVEAPVYFLADPLGVRVAVESFAAGGGLTAGLGEASGIGTGGVAVVETATGDTVAATLGVSAGFSWSPDGSRLAVLEPGDRSGELAVAVWDGTSTRRLLSWAPDPSFFRDVLPFFPQYAQSLRLWSPDSKNLVLAGRIGEESGIWVVPVDGGPPRLVGEGVWVSWSHS